MIHVGNCYIPWAVFTLAELRTISCQIVLLAIWGAVLGPLCRRGVTGVALLACYTVAMFFYQRRLASGLPVRFLSLRAWRSSPENFRKTSAFLKALKAKTPAAGVSAEGFGARPVVVITGGERGIGKEVVHQLLREGVDVILCCPFEAEALRTIARLKARVSNSRVHFVKLDLNDEESVRECAAEVLGMTPRIDVLINNSGLVSPLSHKLNKRGYEVVLSINFLGHVLFTELLLERVKASGPSRIVNVASLMHLDACVEGPCKTALDVMAANCDPTSPHHTRNYSLSKLLLVCYTRDLARHLRGTDTAVATLHPGVVITDIYAFAVIFMRVFFRTVFKFPGEGAEVVLYCALADNIRSGSFYADCAEYNSLLSPLAVDDAHNERLRRVLLRYFALDGSKPTGKSLADVVQSTP
ncbi:dehydrogenase-like protein [Leishmania major strain Friedlin]|uniref:Dehydrogenase-like protein n=1 Tax=Leishmania major TaxID=5664 RepID=Q4QHL1_LEIMA|nr:dehydrogenase-like protein [Leishmania major strain Friedlin]CAG9569981.1 dehydrogenase-like_protein [Leishmania major strain Friedlin]CAJ02348.1 dehydrogenase-like protein [Leishmania major strain Friedlin]|eukprot:XP_001681337.1 dehydrogenase-like protein [Leishmania major strain Friedlin]